MLAFAAAGNGWCANEQLLVVLASRRAVCNPITFTDSFYFYGDWP